jgi:mono/diheme cytochrome c family protein
VLAVGGPARAADGPDGARIYAEQCSGCHGIDGRGDGPAAPGLVPKPRNFRDAAFWKDRSAADLEAIVRNGKPGSMMMAFGSALSDAEITAVVRFVQSLAPAPTP